MTNGPYDFSDMVGVLACLYVLEQQVTGKQAQGLLHKRWMQDGFVEACQLHHHEHE